MKEILFTKSGNAVHITGPSGEALPELLRCQICQEFKYLHRSMERVHYRNRFVAEDISLVAAEGRGGFWTSACMNGWLNRWFQSKGYGVRWEDTTPLELFYDNLEPDWQLLSNYSFRNGQRECIEAFVKKKHGIICAPVGFGKTFLLTVLIQLYPKARFHICTRSRDVLNEIYRRLLTVTPNVGMYTGDTKILDKRVTCITADSLGCLDPDVEFLIFDECHQAAANTYSNVISSKYRFSRRYGFSATPEGRSDGADRVLTFLFGDVIYHMTYEEAVRGGLVVPIQVRWLPCRESDVCNSDNKTIQFRTCIWRNTFRNAAIANFISRECKPEDKVLVLVQTLEHAVYLRQYLPDFELVYSTITKQDTAKYMQMGLLPSDFTPRKPKERKAMQERFKKGDFRRAIATDVWNTGVDFPDLKFVINATGRASSILTTQGGGRASRIAEGKQNATVVDIEDLFEQGSFYSGAFSRKKTYEELGWTQIGWEPKGHRQ